VASEALQYAECLETISITGISRGASCSGMKGESGKEKSARMRGKGRTFYTITAELYGINQEWHNMSRWIRMRGWEEKTRQSAAPRSLLSVLQCCLILAAFRRRQAKCFP